MSPCDLQIPCPIKYGNHCELPSQLPLVSQVHSQVLPYCHKLAAKEARGQMSSICFPRKDFPWLCHHEVETAALVPNIHCDSAPPLPLATPFLASPVPIRINDLHTDVSSPQKSACASPFIHKSSWSPSSSGGTDNTCLKIFTVLLHIHTHGGTPGLGVETVSTSESATGREHLVLRELRRVSSLLHHQGHHTAQNTGRCGSATA